MKHTNNRRFNKQIDDVVFGLLNYMNEKKLTFFKLFVELDKNKDNKISRLEMRTFVKQKLHLSINDTQLEDVLGYFDKNSDKEINAKEFIDKMKQFATEVKELDHYKNFKEEVPMTL